MLKSLSGGGFFFCFVGNERSDDSGLHGRTVPCVLTLMCHHGEDISNPFVSITLHLTCEMLEQLGHR